MHATTWERQQLLGVLCALLTCTTVPLQVLVRDAACSPFRSALEALLTPPKRRLARASDSDEAAPPLPRNALGVELELEVDEPVWCERLGREMAEDLVLLFFMQAYAQPSERLAAIHFPVLVLYEDSRTRISSNHSQKESCKL